MYNIPPTFVLFKWIKTKAKKDGQKYVVSQISVTMGHPDHQWLIYMAQNCSPPGVIDRLTPSTLVMLSFHDYYYLFNTKRARTNDFRLFNGGEKPLSEFHFMKMKDT